MPIRFNCDQCDTRIRVPDGSEGKRVRCPKCNTKQRVPGSPKPTPDRDLIDIGGADPKDKSRPKKYNPKPPKVDSAALMDELKHIADEPSVDLDAPEPSEVAPASAEPKPAHASASPPDPEPTPDPEPAPTPDSESPSIPDSPAPSDGSLQRPVDSHPDDPQPDTDESPDQSPHDDEPATRTPDDQADADIADDIAALAADSAEHADEPDAIAPPEDEPPQLTALTDDRRVESTPAIESKPKAPPITARAPINLDDSDAAESDPEPQKSSTPPPPKAARSLAPPPGKPQPVDDDNDDEPIAQLFADDDDDDPPAPIISEEPPMPIAPNSRPTDAPMFMGLLVISYLLRFLAGLQLIITCAVAATDPFDLATQSLVTKIIVVLAGLTPALITFAIGEAASALRHIARNSFR